MIIEKQPNYAAPLRKSAESGLIDGRALWFHRAHKQRDSAVAGWPQRQTARISCGTAVQNRVEMPT